MFKLFKGLLVGLFVVLLLVDFLPIEFLLITGILLIVLGIILFFLFHLGVQDFQGY
jgi:hypothetical protein